MYRFLRRHIVMFGCRPAGYVTSWAGRDITRASAIIGGFIFSAIFMHALRKRLIVLRHIMRMMEQRQQAETHSRLHPLTAWYLATEGDYEGAIATFRFFLLQGVGVVLEDAFTKVTDRPVEGWLGRLWLLGWQTWLVPDLWEAWSVHLSGPH